MRSAPTVRPRCATAPPHRCSPPKASAARGRSNPPTSRSTRARSSDSAGLLGAGHTELARLIAGADKADAGTVRVKGKKVALSSPVVGLANGIAYSTESRRDDGIVGDLSIRENIVLAVQARRGWMRRVPAKEVDQLVKTYMERFSVRPNDPDRPIRLLSGGNQQKVLLGRWLATDPDLAPARRARAASTSADIHRKEVTVAGYRVSPDGLAGHRRCG